MRGFRQFCAGIAVLFVFWSAQTASAQYRPGQQQNHAAGGLSWPPPQLSGQMPFYQGSPSPGALPSPIVPARFQQGVPAGAPGMAPMYGPANQLQPYPGLDLFRYGTQRTTNVGGLWYKEMLNTRRDFNASVEYLLPIYNSPGNRLFGYGGISTGVDETDQIPPFDISIPRDTDISANGGGTGGGGGGGGNNNNNNVVIPDDIQDMYFPYRTFDQMFGNQAGDGIRVNLGFTNEDGSGLSVSGWYGGEANDTFQRGAEPRRTYIPQEDPFDNPLSGNDPQYLTELNALNGSLPINDGSGVADRIPFDTLFEMQFSQQAWGAGLQVLRPPVVRGSWYTLRPIIGLKYVDIRESFKFRGLDSGAEYEFFNFSNVTLGTGGNNNGGGGNNNNNNTTVEEADGRPDQDTFNDGTTNGNPAANRPNVAPLPTNPYEVQIGASNQARSAGPEFGFRADLQGGGDTRLWFVATAGLAATRETTNLSGFGVYNHFLNSVDPDNNILTPDGGELGTGVGALTDAQTAFNEQATITHVSPMLDLAVNFEIKVFEHIPLLNRVEFLEDARFKTSYGFLYVGNITRPQNSINYTSFPINPSIDPDRSGWTMQKWSFGIDWEY